MVRKCVVSLAAGSVLVKRAMPKRKPSTTTLTESHISNLPSELALGPFFEWVHERTGCNQLRIKQEGRKTYAFAAVDLENKTEKGISDIAHQMHGQTYYGRVLKCYPAILGRWVNDGECDLIPPVMIPISLAEDRPAES